MNFERCLWSFILNDKSQLVALGNILELRKDHYFCSKFQELNTHGVAFRALAQARRTLGSSKRFMDGASCTVCSWLGGVSWESAHQPWVSWESAHQPWVSGEPLTTVLLTFSLSSLESLMKQSRTLWALLGTSPSCVLCFWFVGHKLHSASHTFPDIQRADSNSCSPVCRSRSNA